MRDDQWVQLLRVVRGEQVRPLPVGLIIDCAALEYVSSAGLRSFLVVARSATKRSLAFHICGLTTDVAEVFRVSGFEKIIPPLPDRAAAEAALSA